MRLRSRGALVRQRSISLFAVLMAIALLIPAGALAHHKPGHPKSQPVEIQFLNVSDWHGQIVPVGGVGGSAALAAYWEADRAANPNTITLTAGDDFGATPPISTFFDDEPAVIAQRMMGMQFGTFGNHNFDRGTDHLQRMIDLARTPSANVPGSPYQYVSANLANIKQNLRHVKPYEIVKVGGVKVAIIGITNEEAPTLVFPGSFGTIEITDGVAAANTHARLARRQGADAVVVITHKGLRTLTPPAGELIDFAEALEPGLVDVVFGDHTDILYSALHNGILVQENRSKGLTYSKTSLTVQPGVGVTAKSVEFVTPLVANVTPDPEIAAYIDELQQALAPILGAQVASSTKEITRADQCGRADGRLCESLVGNVVTDAMRASFPDVDFAITNSGGLRAALTCPAGATDPSPDDFCPAGLYPVPDASGLWPITEGTVLGVLPFGNIVVTVDVTGAELKTMLENGVSQMPGADGRFPQVSGLCFTYDISAAAGDRVTGAVRQNADGTCSSTSVDLTSASTYRIVENDFMASGGDAYPNFSARMVTGDIMAQAVSNWLSANSPVSPFVLAAPNGRINCTSSGATACPTLTPSP